ncbi:MAG TPA: hypothetical protein DF613_04670 [Lachnospiraceae bacterium]|nr:hypothetical protein [Lachnospiraceae bacterium]
MAKTTEKGKKAMGIMDWLGIVSNEYDWKAIDENVYNAGKYIAAALPAVGLTLVAYLFVPPAAAAGAFALAGSGASALTYMATNGIVASGGLYKIVKDVSKVGDPERTG